MTFEQLALILKGRILNFYTNGVIESVFLDSRKLPVIKTSMFIAIKGKRHDGHLFIKELYEKGIRCFIVEKNQFQYALLKYLPKANILEVDSAIQALQGYAIAHRKQFNIPILGITGSNGKTIVKEWLSSAILKKYNIIKNPKSYNSQVGVPISVLLLSNITEFGIFEAGISKKEEMINLFNIINPNLGIFTNIGSAHDSNFISRKDKTKEKAILFRNCKKLFYCKDHTVIDEVINDLYKDKIKITWSVDQNKKATFYVTITISNCQEVSQINILTAHKEYNFTLPFINKVFIENAIHCIVFLITENFSLQSIQESLDNFQPIPMRLIVKNGINGCKIIDDTYCNDLVSFNAALDFLNQQNSILKKTVIISDFLEASIDPDQLYYDVANLINRKKIERIIGIGNTISKYKSLFKIPESSFYSSIDSFLQDVNFKIKEEFVLIKGARTFKFEKIVSKIQEKIHNTILEVNLDHITDNLNFFRNTLSPKTKIMVMVKALAYGSGITEISNLLLHHKVDYLGVAYVDEGIFLRKNGISTPIMVMNPTVCSFDLIKLYKLEPVIFNKNLFHSLKNYEDIRIHIKLDTGMHRLGFVEDDLGFLENRLRIEKNINVMSIYSHLGSAENPEFTKSQVLSFNQMYSKLSSVLNYKPIKHILNTTGILKYKSYHFDMVRLGIGLYGVGISKEYKKYLKPVHNLKTVISQIKFLKKGSYVGYGRTGKINKNRKIATIAIGYADGFSRSFSNGIGKVFVNGSLAKVIGNVCMDMTMIDITDIDAKEGDPVVVFGQDNCVDKLAHSVDSISYEIISQVSHRVKRIYLQS